MKDFSSFLSNDDYRYFVHLGWIVPVIAITTKYLFWIKKGDQKENLVRAHGYPFIGTVDLITQPRKFTEKMRMLSDQYGNTFEFYLFGQRVIVISDQFLLQEVLSKRPHIFRRSEVIGTYNYNDDKLNLIGNYTETEYTVYYISSWLLCLLKYEYFLISIPIIYIIYLGRVGKLLGIDGTAFFAEGGCLLIF